MPGLFAIFLSAEHRLKPSRICQPLTQGQVEEAMLQVGQQAGDVHRLGVEF